MSGRIRSHIRSNVYGLLALFLVLTGGTAQALNGSNTVFTDDIVNGQVTRDDLAPSAVRTGRVLDNNLLGDDIADGTLTGADINESTLAGVDDTCLNLMTRFGGVICIDDNSRGEGMWGTAVQTCAGAELRLPTPTELYLAYDRGHMDIDELVWTDAVSDQATGTGSDQIVDEAVALYEANGEMYGLSVGAELDIYCAVAPSDLY